MLCCFVMRVVVWVDGLNASTEMAPGAVMSTYIGDGTLRLEAHVKEILMQLIQCCFAISTILVFVRFFDNLSVFPSIAELTTILYGMFRASWSLIIMITWTAVGFGAAFAGLVPIGASDPRYFSRPFWYGFRAILGDLDIEHTYELLGDSWTPEQVIAAAEASRLLPDLSPESTPLTAVAFISCGGRAEHHRLRLHPAQVGVRLLHDDLHRQPAHRADDNRIRDYPRGVDSSSQVPARRPHRRVQGLALNLSSTAQPDRVHHEALHHPATAQVDDAQVRRHEAPQGGARLLGGECHVIAEFGGIVELRLAIMAPSACSLSGR